MGKKCKERKDALKLNLESFVYSLLMEKIAERKKEWTDMKIRKRDAIVKNIEDMIRYCKKE